VKKVQLTHKESLPWAFQQAINQDSVSP